MPPPPCFELVADLVECVRDEAARGLRVDARLPGRVIFRIPIRCEATCPGGRLPAMRVQFLQEPVVLGRVGEPPVAADVQQQFPAEVVLRRYRRVNRGEELVRPELPKPFRVDNTRAARATSGAVAPNRLADC